MIEIPYPYNGKTPLVAPLQYFGIVNDKVMCIIEKHMIDVLEANSLKIIATVECDGDKKLLGHTYNNAINDPDSKPFDKNIDGHIIYWGMGIITTWFEHMHKLNIPVTESAIRVYTAATVTLIIKMRGDHIHDVSIPDTTDINVNEVTDAEIFLMKSMDWNIFNGLRRGLPSHYSLRDLILEPS